MTAAMITVMTMWMCGIMCRAMASRALIQR